MRYSEFIKENTAYLKSGRIGVYENNRKIGIIPLGSLFNPAKAPKLYSFGAISDVHVSSPNSPNFMQTLKYLNETESVDFICIAGDLTENGTSSEFSGYSTCVLSNSPNTPVYSVTGNHDYYETVSQSYLEQYTGYPLYYSFTHGNDVYIMCGMYSPAPNQIFTQGCLQWLYEILEKNRNKRCFIFEHVFPPNDCGNPCGFYEHDIFSSVKGDVFLSLLKHYKNTILFHGHSHSRFNLQKLDLKANYSSESGYKSVHIPSAGACRYIVNGEMIQSQNISEGYVVDVYDNGIHLRGIDFITGKYLPIASYWIDTALQDIPAGEFYDGTGTINVLPTGYTQLDYIETTGTQYIDTGFIPNQDSRIVCEFMYLGGTGIYGARTSTAGENFALRVINNKWQPGYHKVHSSSIASDDNWHTADQDKNVFSIDGEVAIECAEAEFVSPQSIILGGINAKNAVYYGLGRYRTCQIYDNGVMVRDLIPCKNADGEIGMYDMLNAVFYGNAGTGTFVAGFKI